MEVKIRWKEENKTYLNAMQAFLDKVDNVKDEKLRMDIITKMLKCDKILTELALDEISKNKNAENNK